MALRIKYTEQKPVPEGYYVARLDGLEPVTNQFGDSVKWTFTIQAPADFVGTQVTGMSSTKVSPKSKMFAWLQAFGVVLNPDDEFDVETLLGKLCQVRIVNKSKTTVKDGREQSTTFSNVDAIAAYIPQQNVVSSSVQPPQQQTAQGYANSQNMMPQQGAQSQNLQPQQSVQQPPMQPHQGTTQNNVVPPHQVSPDEDFDF